jgi:hypothetical protein
MRRWADRLTCSLVGMSERRAGQRTSRQTRCRSHREDSLPHRLAPSVNDTYIRLYTASGAFRHIQGASHDRRPVGFSTRLENPVSSVRIASSQRPALNVRAEEPRPGRRSRHGGGAAGAGRRRRPGPGTRSTADECPRRASRRGDVGGDARTRRREAGRARFLARFAYRRGGPGRPRSSSGGSSSPSSSRRARARARRFPLFTRSRFARFQARRRSRAASAAAGSSSRRRRVQSSSSSRSRSCRSRRSSREHEPHSDRRPSSSRRSRQNASRGRSRPQREHGFDAGAGPCRIPPEREFGGRWWALEGGSKIPEEGASAMPRSVAVDADVARDVGRRAS